VFNRVVNALKQFNNRQKGISGLETAIILIAFVTVASVLAYSVLSAGIFSAEQGHAVVYQGLEGAQSTVELKGAVLGMGTQGVDPDPDTLTSVQFVIGMALAGNTVDMDALSINFWDDTVSSTAVTWSYALSAQSAERGSANLLEGDELMVITVTVPAIAEVVIYDTFTLQVLPPKGAALTIERTVGGAIYDVMTLN
jgi:flagellin FlaB